MFDEIVEKIRELKLEDIIRGSKHVRIIDEVTGEPRITLLKELKVANINKGDKAIVFVPDEKIVIVVGV